MLFEGWIGASQPRETRQRLNQATIRLQLKIGLPSEDERAVGGSG